MRAFHAFIQDACDVPAPYLSLPFLPLSVILLVWRLAQVILIAFRRPLPALNSCTAAIFTCLRSFMWKAAHLAHGCLDAHARNLVVKHACVCMSLYSWHACATVAVEVTCNVDHVNRFRNLTNRSTRGAAALRRMCDALMHTLDGRELYG